MKQPDTQETNPERPTALAGAPGSAAFDKWCKTSGVWPRLTHEEIWHAAWNAAIKAAMREVEIERENYDPGSLRWVALDLAENAIMSHLPKDKLSNRTPNH